MDDLFYQLAQIDKELQGMEHHIDPVDYGELKGRVDALGKKIDSVEKKVDRLVTLASEGQGGIRALWFAGSVVAGVLGWIGADKLFKG